MTNNPMDQQLIALAGVAQAARLVDQISKTGSCSSEFLTASIHSLFRFESDSALDIYSDLASIKLGLQNLTAILSRGREQQHPDTVRYLFGLLYLERKFVGDASMMTVVRSRLEHTQFRSEHFTDDIYSLCHSISGIYQDTLSQLNFRIQVTGSEQHLKNERNADMIRAALLAGIRAAFLWRQLGGRRWKLMWQRQALLRRAQALSQSPSTVV